LDSYPYYSILYTDTLNFLLPRRLFICLFRQFYLQQQFFFILFFAILKGKVFKVVLKKVIYTLLIIAVTQLFWILPFIFYTLTTSQDLLGSFVNRSITTSVLDLETQMQTPINSARLYSRILTDSGGRDVLFGMGDDYLIYDFYKVFGLFPAIFSLLLVPFAILKKKNALLFFPLFAIGSWFFIKVTNPPLGVVFTWFQDNIPLFKQVFRWPVSKLGNIFLLNHIKELVYPPSR